MRKAMKALGQFILKLLGQEPYRLEIGVKTQFRGKKNQLLLPEWQEIADVFKRTPDLEEYLATQLETMAVALRVTPISEDGDRQRLVIQTQMEVLQDVLNLPTKAAAKVQEMLKPKKVQIVKGNEYAL